MMASDNIENIVLGIVREYLSKKPFFSISNIVEFINNRVKKNPDINKNKIELIIKSLIKKRVIIAGTKLMKNNIIENPTRNEIYKYIIKNPGRNINEIMKQHKLGSNLALWHLSALEKFQFIRSKKMGNRMTFFKYDSDPKLDDLNYYLRTGIIQKIISYLKKEDKALKITQIAEGLKKNHNTIRKYLDILIKLKLIIIEKEKTRDIYKLDKERYSKVIKTIKKSN